MFECEGFILAGGASSRMGRDKARLQLDDETFLTRIAHALETITQCVSVVSTRTDATEFGLPVVADIFRDCGALGGLHAALTVCRAPWAAVVSCDLPFASGELWRRLASFSSPEFDAVVPIQSDGRAQTLCALYARAACLPLMEALLKSGELRPRVLLGQLRARRVEPAELVDLAQADLLFLNVNTPADYEEARRKARV